MADAPPKSDGSKPDPWDYAAVRRSAAGERYGAALFELADEQNALEAVEADLDTFGAAVNASKELRQALKSPLYRKADKVKALEALCDKLELGDLVKRFLLVVARNGRAGDLYDAVIAFKALAAKRRGATAAEILSADALTKAQKEELAAALKRALGREVEMRAHVDKNLIGGLIVKVGSRQYDGSLRTKLEHARAAMKAG